MGIIFKIPGYIIYTVSGIWGFFISLGIVIDNLGFIGGVIAFIIAPVTFTFAPIYEGLANSNWFPFFLIYGGGFVASLFTGIGSLIDRK